MKLGFSRKRIQHVMSTFILKEENEYFCKSSNEFDLMTSLSQLPNYVLYIGWLSSEQYSAYIYVCHVLFKQFEWGNSYTSKIVVKALPVLVRRKQTSFRVSSCWIGIHRTPSPHKIFYYIVYHVFGFSKSISQPNFSQIKLTGGILWEKPL